jgi:hypothetical protein
MEVENKDLLIAIIIFSNVKTIPDYHKLFCDDILIPDNFFDSMPDDELVSKLCFKNNHILVLKDIDSRGRECDLRLDYSRQYYFKKPNDSFSYLKDKEDLRMTKGKSLEILPSKLKPKKIIEDGLFTIDSIEKYYPDHFFKYFTDTGYRLMCFEYNYYPVYQKI